MLHNAKRNSFEIKLSETTNQSRYSVWQIWRNWYWFLYPMLNMQKTWSAVTSVNAPSLVKCSNTRQKHLLQPSQAHCWSNTGKCRELIRLMTTSGTAIVNCWRGRDNSRWLLGMQKANTFMISSLGHGWKGRELVILLWDIEGCVTFGL